MGILEKAPTSGYVSQSILDEYDAIINEIRKEAPEIAQSFEIKVQYRSFDRSFGLGMRCDATYLQTQGTGLLRYFSVTSEDKKIGFDVD